MSSIKITYFLLDRVKTYPPVYLPVAAGKVHTTLGCWRLGVLFENPLKLHTHCLPRVWATPVVADFLIIGNLGLCRFFTGNLGLLFPNEISNLSRAR